jgi:hypothetical protein
MQAVGFELCANLLCRVCLVWLCTMWRGVNFYRSEAAVSEEWESSHGVYSNRHLVFCDVDTK